MERTWRDIARPIIEKVLEENKGKPDIVIRQALFKAYPFGERRYHPYKIWCDEIQRQRGKRECFEDGEMSDFPEKLYSVDPPNQSSDGLYMIVHTKKTDKYTVEYTRTPPTPPDEEGEKLVDMSTKSLKMERERFQAYIDGPENDHRTTSYGSASLDYWMDTIEDIDRELERRRILSLPKTEREKMSRLSQHEELVRAAKEVAKIITEFLAKVF